MSREWNSVKLVGAEYETEKVLGANSMTSRTYRVWSNALPLVMHS